MNKKENQAVEEFRNNYNCAQSVLSAFADELGLSKDLSMRLASPFGAGIAFRQEMCGAVTGSLMAIGLKYGKGEHGTNEDKEKAYDLSNYFIAEFMKLHKSTCCRELMDGIDFSTPEGIAKYRESNIERLRCENFVKDAVSITRKILNHR